MAIALSTIHSYLSDPGRNESNQPAIKGTNVPLAGKLFEMLSRVS